MRLLVFEVGMDVLIWSSRDKNARLDVKDEVVTSLHRAHASNNQLFVVKENQLFLLLIVVRTHHFFMFLPTVVFGLHYPWASAAVISLELFDCMVFKGRALKCLQTLRCFRTMQSVNSEGKSIIRNIIFHSERSIFGIVVIFICKIDWSH